MKKSYNNSITIIFITYILSIMILNIVTPVRTFSEEENRELSQAPRFTFEKLKSGQFTKDFESYIADQFPKRDFFVGVKAKTEMLLMKQENNDIYKGKDGYLMQKFKGHEDINNKVTALNNFFKAIPDTKKYFMLVPNSVEILSNKLPYAAPVENELPYINKVRSLLNKDVKFVDVYSLLNSKRNEYIYYKTDHHWTTDGAFYAYEKFCKGAEINENGEDKYNINTVTKTFLGSSYSKGGFKDVAPDSIKLYIPKEKENYVVEYSDIKTKNNSLYSLENLNKKDKYAVFLGGNHPLVKISTDAKDNKKLLIIKDSYANSFVPFLTSNYSEIYMVDLRYYDDSVSNFIKENKIDNVLVLYNAITFSEDSSIGDVN